jgi:hypothetical protein
VAKTAVKKLYAVGLDALVKRWERGISVGRGCVPKCFFQVRISLRDQEVHEVSLRDQGIHEVSLRDQRDT